MVFTQFVITVSGKVYGGHGSSNSRSKKVVFWAAGCKNSEVG